MVALGSPVVPDVNPSSATSSLPVRTGVEPHRLVECDAVELCIVIGGAVEADDASQESAAFGRGHQFVGDAVVAQRQTNLGFVGDRGQLTGTQQRHGVDRHGAGLGDGQPHRHHRGVVAGSNEHAVAGLDAKVLDEGVGQPVGPVGQLLVRAPASVADERDVVAEAFLDHAVRQFNRGVQIIRVLKLRPVEQ